MKYKLKDIMPYATKKIRCIKDMSFFKAGEFYEISYFFDLDKDIYIREYSVKIINYQVDVIPYDKTLVGSATFDFHHKDYNAYEDEDSDSGFSEYFELITEPELRQRKIKSILK